MNDENTTPRETPRCVELNLRGYPCGLRAVAGHDRCYIHGIFHALNDGRSTIDIPLLEDPQSILFVYSQVARALAQGVMPAANANGIIRCCNGAMKLLAEMRKHERFEERKKKAQSRSQKAEDRNRQSDRTQEAESAEPAASPLAKHQQDQVDATVPPDFDISQGANQPAAAVAAAVPDTRSDKSDRGHPGITLQATAEDESCETGPKPHTRSVERTRSHLRCIHFRNCPRRAGVRNASGYPSGIAAVSS